MRRTKKQIEAEARRKQIGELETQAAALEYELQNNMFSPKWSVYVSRLNALYHKISVLNGDFVIQDSL
jgi:hypothetical protein